MAGAGAGAGAGYLESTGGGLGKGEQGWNSGWMAELCGAQGGLWLPCKWGACWLGGSGAGQSPFTSPIAPQMWVQYFYTAHFWALFCYALEAGQLLRSPAGCRSLTPYYLLCWGLSSTQCLWGIQQLLSPASARCDSQRPLVQALAVAHYTAAYVPLSLVLLLNPLLLSRALCAGEPAPCPAPGPSWEHWQRCRESGLGSGRAGG
ncbi:G-protein coupled receptor 143-like [Gopherus evgoodei]|uniref:G-protein coupled receptor 143-like n=1 Tax=Gopherus evgoodei TaxID=1825980 RepID=UPI0011D02721|nr:G-protein coupled receptor 143-like [Gopherus evgoodei]